MTPRFNQHAQISPMKTFFRKLFSPILTPLEAGDAPFQSKPSHRHILLVIGVIFSGLASVVLILTPKEELGYLLPVIVFYGVGGTAIIVALLGNDRAVAKVWGN